MLATHGTPRQLESDNEPPLNSKKFAEFAKTEGFHHYRVTTEHARANSEAESFMKLLNKTEQVYQDRKAAIQEMLTGYRSTPHPATGVTPYEALMNRQVRNKLDYRTREGNKESAPQPSATGIKSTKRRSNRVCKTRILRSTTLLLGIIFF